jgi:hypothetical protein
MTIAPILKYPSAKWRIASWLHAYAPRCLRVVEPYCGSAAFSLSLPWRPSHLVLNDLAGDIPALFRTIRDHEAALLKAVTLTPWSRAEYLAVTNRDSTIVRTGDPSRTRVAIWSRPGSSTGRSSAAAAAGAIRGLAAQAPLCCGISCPIAWPLWPLCCAMQRSRVCRR